jgi:biotin carboxylase
MATLLFVGLGLGETKRYIVEGLWRHGYDLVVLAERLPPWIQQYALHGAETDLADASTAVEVATALGRRCTVDGVFTCDEAYVEMTAAVARRLGLPGLTVDAAVLCRDKHAMRRRLAEAGIPSARSVMVGTLPAALRAAEDVGYPVVLKPRNLGGSIGVVKARDAADVTRLFDVSTGATMSRVRSLAGLLVEEYLDGPEFSVESVVADGVTSVCGITEKVLGFAPYFEEVGHFARPVDPSSALDRRLVALAADVHDAIGITTGATHCEVRLTGDGPRVVEIAGRVAGDRIPLVTKLASGIDLLAAAASVATGRPADVRPTRDRVAGIRMVYPPHDGVVERLAAKSGVEDLVEGMGWYATPGQQVALPPRGFLSRLGYLVVAAATRDEVVRRLDEAESMLEIEVAAPEPVPYAPAGSARA